jgi:hypothetical protein
MNTDRSSEFYLLHLWLTSLAQKTTKSRKTKSSDELEPRHAFSGLAAELALDSDQRLN